MDKDEKIQRLEDRIDELEATINKMLPGRRDALKLGGAAALGAAAFSGTASAGTSQVGTIGDASNLVDVQAEDIDASDTITTQDLVVNGTATGPFGGGGIVFEEGDSLTEHTANSVNVGGNSFETVFNLGSAVDIYGGAIFGPDVTVIKVTFGTSTTTTIGIDASARADTGAGEVFSVHPVFPMKNVEKLEFKNGIAGARNFGFQVFTT